MINITNLCNLGQEMAINFVFLCPEICWEGFGATHVLKLRRSFRFELYHHNLILTRLIHHLDYDGTTNQCHRNYHHHHNQP